MHRLVSNIALLTLALQLTSCAPSPEAPIVTPAEPAEKDSAPMEYQVRGVIKGIPETGNSLRIHHEEIPGYMQAMTMPFSVKDRAEFANLELEQTISFTLHVTETESWIDQIQAAKSTPTPGQMPSIESFRQVRDVEPLEVGDTMTNYPFTNQNNQAIQLDEFRGEVLVLTFIYTRCPLPDFCPRMSMHFRAAHDAIQKEDDAPENWHFLSITFDPEYDTPDVLKNYSKAYAGDSTKWSFATGEIIEIDAITEQFGLMFSRSQVSITDWDHNLRTVIIDPQGTIHKIYIGNTWTPDDLVQDLKQAALKGPSTTRAAIEDAIETSDSSATVVAETLDESDSR
jgi:protein SCO1/2